MRERKQRKYVKGYRFLNLARSMGTHAIKVAKNLTNKYGRKLVDTAKKSATNALKIAAKEQFKKTAEASGDLVGYFIAEKITSISKTPASEQH